MNCPTCDVPLQARSGESERESGDPGEYTRIYVSQWFSLTCPKCRRSTGPRGAMEWARNDVRAWECRETRAYLRGEFWIREHGEPQ